MYRKKRILSTALFTSMVSLMVCGVCNAGSDTIAERMAELKTLQAENSSLNFNPNNTVAFPGTFQDLSRQERMDIYTQSYQPFFNRDAYRPLNVVDDTADRKARDCDKVYACVEQYGKAEKEAEDAFFKAYIEYANAFHLESDAKKNAAIDKWYKTLEPFVENLMAAEISPCFCVKDLDFAEYILKDLNLSCTEERIEQAGQNAKAYYDKLMEELKAVDEEWIEANKDRTYNNHVVVKTAAVKNEAVPTVKHTMTISNAYDPENYHNRGKCVVQDLTGSGAGGGLRNEENLFIGKCYDNKWGYYVNDDWEDDCADEYVCILGKSCADDHEQENFCWYADAADGGDEWEDNVMSDGRGYSMTKCSGGKWPGSGTDKISVFVDKSGKVIKNDQGYFPQSIVGPGSYDVSCYAYICKNGTYGCSDGTCPDVGGICVPEKHAPKAEPWTTDTKHRDTIKPYLDVLSKCKSSSSKTGNK